MLNSFSDEQSTNGSDNHLVLSGSEKEKPESIVITIDATHAGYKNKNFFYYDPESMKYAVQQDTWTKPFPKPLLKNHDLDSEPLGRVQAARYIDTMDGKGYTQLDVKVTDSEAIDKILDGRYLTVSTHGAPMQDADLRHNFVQCSICGTNLNKDEWCGHSRGQMYAEDEESATEELCYWKVGAMDYKEVSIVNNPADNDGSTAAQITAVSMIDGENPVLSQDSGENKNSNFLIFRDSDVEYADESFLNLEDKKSVVANMALWDSVGQDAEKYIASKGLILSANKTFKGKGDTDGDLIAADDSKAGYPPNCNAGYKVATVDGKKKCVASKGKSKTSSKKSSYDAEALLEDILNLKESETDANTKSVEKKSNSSDVKSEDKAQEEVESILDSLKLSKLT